MALTPLSSLLPSPSCDLLMISEKTTTSHPSLVFSFRPSWSSSTPAYGTLLPWGRTTRRPSPVSPFFFFSHLFSLCRFRHSAKPPHSLRLFPFLSLSLSPRPCVDLSTYLSFMPWDFNLLAKRARPYHVMHSLFGLACKL